MEVRYPSIPLNLQLQLNKLNRLLSPLPDPQTKVGAAVTGVGATGNFAPLPGIQTISVEVDQPAWVTVTAGAWMQPLAGGSDVRAGVALSGATIVSAQDHPSGASAWGQTLWALSSYQQSSLTRELKINAGVTIFTFVAYVYAGSGNVNYPTFTVTPRAWASLEDEIVDPE